MLAYQSQESTRILNSRIEQDYGFHGTPHFRLWLGSNFVGVTNKFAKYWWFHDNWTRRQLNEVTVMCQRTLPQRLVYTMAIIALS
jgi:hypothetical protein